MVNTYLTPILCKAGEKESETTSRIKVRQAVLQHTGQWRVQKILTSQFDLGTLGVGLVNSRGVELQIPTAFLLNKT